MDKQLKQKYENIKKRHVELDNDYKRAVADYRNLVKRTEVEKANVIKFANGVLIVKILEVLDDLEKSQNHINDEGIQNVIKKLKKILSDEGVTQFGDINDDFSPDFHEAIESCEGKEGKIVKVHRKGYKLVDKVIRPALVAVGTSNRQRENQVTSN